MEDRLKIVIDQMMRSNTSFKDAVAGFKEGYLQKALDLNQGNQSRAAETLGLDEDSFRRKVKKYKIRTTRIRQSQRVGNPPQHRAASKKYVLFA